MNNGFGFRSNSHSQSQISNNQESVNNRTNSGYKERELRSRDRSPSAENGNKHSFFGLQTPKCQGTDQNSSLKKSSKEKKQINKQRNDVVDQNNKYSQFDNPEDLYPEKQKVAAAPSLRKNNKKCISDEELSINDILERQDDRNNNQGSKQ